MCNFQFLLNLFSGFSVDSPWGSPATCCLGFSVGFFRVLFSFFFQCVKGQNYVQFSIFVEFVFRVLRWFSVGFSSLLIFVVCFSSRVLRWFSVGFSSNLLFGVLCGVLSGSLLFIFPLFQGTGLCGIFYFC